MLVREDEKVQLYVHFVEIRVRKREKSYFEVTKVEKYRKEASAHEIRETNFEVYFLSPLSQLNEFRYFVSSIRYFTSQN